MSICEKCKKRNECKRACKELKQELSQVTTHRSKREKSFNPRLINNKLSVDKTKSEHLLGSADITSQYEWIDKEELEKKRPKFAGNYIRKTFLEKNYNRIHNKYSFCYVYENKNGKKGKLKRKI